MLTKKILKDVLNVKHTAIDNMKILPDGSFAIMVHPTKGEQCCCKSDADVVEQHRTNHQQGKERDRS